MMTTLAWVVFDICVSLASRRFCYQGREGGCRSPRRTAPAASYVWALPELCKKRNPYSTSLACKSRNNDRNQPLSDDFPLSIQYRAARSRSNASQELRYVVNSDMRRLDAIDRNILRELQDDRGITNVELAPRVGN